jgi:threonine/homoserine/homoserine lactone efflux protein
VLCIRRTIAEGRSAGLASGLGAAVADAVYGCIAAFGLTVVSDALVAQQNLIRLIGGAFMLWLGVRTFLARPAEQAAQAQGRGLLGAFGSTFVLTLTNPMTILSFVAIFAAVGLGAAAASHGSAAIMVLGVLLGSASWWFLLSAAVSLFRDRFDAGGLRWVNRISGAVICTFGVLAVASLMAPRGER